MKKWATREWNLCGCFILLLRLDFSKCCAADGSGFALMLTDWQACYSTEHPHSVRRDKLLSRQSVPTRLRQSASIWGVWEASANVTSALSPHRDTRRRSEAKPITLMTVQSPWPIRNADSPSACLNMSADTGRREGAEGLYFDSD